MRRIPPVLFVLLALASGPTVTLACPGPALPPIVLVTSPLCTPPDCRVDARLLGSWTDQNAAQWHVSPAGDSTLHISGKGAGGGFELPVRTLLVGGRGYLSVEVPLQSVVSEPPAGLPDRVHLLLEYSVDPDGGVRVHAPSVRRLEGTAWKSELEAAIDVPFEAHSVSDFWLILDVPAGSVPVFLSALPQHLFQELPAGLESVLQLVLRRPPAGDGWPADPEASCCRGEPRTP